jgi:starvation-inducible DNA-binding protein
MPFVGWPRQDESSNKKNVCRGGHTMQMTTQVLESNVEADVTEILNVVLADEHVLYIKTRNYHWNVVGPEFYAYHKFFESQYEELEEIIDKIAERARAVGGSALGTMKELAERARLKEHPGEVPDAQTMIANLLHDHETVIANLRNDIDLCDTCHRDTGTADFLTEVMAEHDKVAWMLRASLGQG